MLLVLSSFFFNVFLNLEYENENMGLDYEDIHGLDYEDPAASLDYWDQSGELYFHFCNSKV